VLDAFYVIVHGEVESAEFMDDDLYARYGVVLGRDWSVVDGIETGLSQIARKAAGPDKRVIWNFPIDVSFKSTNIFGWPRLSLSVYGLDTLGRDVVRGYGSVLIPTFPGTYERNVQLYLPLPASLWQRFISWLTGAYSEFYDSKFVARDFDRHLTRVEPTGTIKIKVQVLTRGLHLLGYVPPVSNYHHP